MKLIRNAHVVDPATDTDGVKDILIDRNGLIAEVGSGLSGGEAEVIDASGLHAFPGLVDLHVHLRDPGQEWKEDIHTGCDAAVKGGFTTICCMPNTTPVNDSKTTTGYMVEKARAYGKCSVLPFGTITLGMKGETIAPMAEMMEAGAIGFSEDGRNVDNSEVMRIALEYASMFGALIAVHNEDPYVGRGGVVHEGVYSSKAGLKGIPDIKESLMVARDIELAYYTGCPVHFCHISTRRSVELIRNAKAQGLPVTAEVAPHHLFLNDSLITTYDTNYKMNPPLRSEDDRLACLEGLADGTIDVIATDHAPHAITDKEKDFDHAAFGVIGLETALPLTLHLVRENVLSLRQLIERLSTTPARILGRNTQIGTLAPGARADLVLVDLERKDIVGDDFFASKSHNSPFLGQQVQGLPVSTYYGGTCVYKA
ncbi:dihydroorotase [Desulfurispira natronophila]|uniref:Dihydroorotase n=1 Tax=Desulfurispira natronophila TaxID=682562 RepID=A0A7W7Y3C7_9BACT|nr:dihydroorotase [Desulfurispira natronophila]MBB5021057.1 dihydroorotase [Desulfurispira natronophila]